MVGLAGCGIPGNIVDEGRGDLIGDVDASAPTMNTGTMRDPVDDSFTVDVPAGWDSVAYSSGAFEVHRHVVSSVSPDGKTVRFVGDPRILFCWDPAFATDIFRQRVGAFDFSEIQAFQPSEVYLPQYVTCKFADLPEFELTSVGPEPAVLARIKQGLIAGAGFTATGICQGG